MTETVYISGPMSGLPGLNFEAFNEAEKMLIDNGYKVHNPASLGSKAPRHELMKKEFLLLLDSDKVFVLSSWEDSWGAVLEVMLAREIGLKIYDLEFNEITYNPPLVEAQRLINVERNNDYGHPIDDYTRTGNMWSQIMGVDVTSYQAVMAMMLVKMSRQVHKYSYDSVVDLAGYAGCLEKIRREEQRREDAER